VSAIKTISALSREIQIESQLGEVKSVLVALTTTGADSKDLLSEKDSVKVAKWVKSHGYKFKHLMVGRTPAIEVRLRD